MVTGSLRSIKDELQPTSLEDILRGMEVVAEQDIPPLARFLRRCFALDPGSRPSAQELLEDDWLR